MCEKAIAKTKTSWACMSMNINPKNSFRFLQEHFAYKQYWYKWKVASHFLCVTAFLKTVKKKTADGTQLWRNYPK